MSVSGHEGGSRVTDTDDSGRDWTVPTHESVLVTGPSEDTVDGVVRRLVGTRPGLAGGLVVTTRDGTVELVSGRQNATDAFADGAAGIVDCTPGTTTEVDRDGLRWRVTSPTEFTGIGMAISDGLDALAERGVETPWVVFDTLSTSFVSGPSNDVIRFAHAVHSQVTARGGICVFPVYTNVTTGRDLERCKHLANTHVAVRKRGGSRRLSVTGLPSAPDGWLPLDGTGDPTDLTAGTTDARVP